jgi:hypothetical protein
MSDEPKKRRSWGWIGWALIAVVLYPLSMGPALAIVEATRHGSTLFVALYLPLYALVGASPRFGAALEWYCSLWVKP